MVYKSCRFIEVIFLKTPYLKRRYLNFAPNFYKNILKPEICIQIDGVNPFALRYVDPNNVERFSQLPNVASERVFDIGAIIGGDWDLRVTHDKKPIFKTDRFSNTIFYKSLEEHFVENKPWENTELVQSFFELAESNDLRWHGCNTQEDILNRCKYIDRLYNSIKREGYKTQTELLRSGDICSLKNLGYLNAKINEITVDISRNGDFMFVDGRHRLAIAKILNLETIPVLIIARHKHWAQKLLEYYNSSVDFDHPDVNSQASNNGWQ